MITKIPLEHFLVIDIETVSQQEDFDLLSDDWKQLWEEKVKWSLPKDVSAAGHYPQRAGIMAEFGKVICISMGYFKQEGDSYEFCVRSFYNKNEKALLRNFVQAVTVFAAGKNNWSFTGHNIKEFDIPFLCRRLLVNRLPIPPYLDFQNMKPWETNMVDTFQYWRFGDYKHFTSLKLLAASLGIPSPKDDIDGSMVGDTYWKEKNIRRIVSYCRKDVTTVANIILSFRNEPLLNDEQVVLVNGQ